METNLGMRALVSKVLENLEQDLEEKPNPSPRPGDGATVLGWTDSRAYTVISVSPKGKTAVLQRDKARLLNAVGSGEADALKFSPGGFVGHTSGQQRYEINRDVSGETVTARLHRDGRWYLSKSTTRVLMGQRSEYYDFNF
jgi:hypothetical protein